MIDTMKKTHRFAAAVQPLATFALAAALAGCAASYEPPPAGARQTARVRVAQAQQGAQLMAMELPGACRPNLTWNTGYRHIATLAGSNIMLAPHRRAVLGMPDPRHPEGSFTEFVVPADRPFHLGTYFEASVTTRSVTSCTVAVTFQPEPGADYEAVLTTTFNGCVLTLSRLTSQQGTVTRNPVQATPISERCQAPKP